MIERRLSIAVVAFAVWLPLAPGAAAAQGPPAPPNAAAQADNTPCLEEIGGRLISCGEVVVVTADPDAPVLDSSVATKIDTPLIETPRSISVIDRATLDDLGAISITQAHDYAVGVTLPDERGPAFARGFPVDFYDLRRDGLRTYSWSVREPAAVERIQYLRGPASVFYGDGSPGALVNMVLKKPLAAPRYEFAVAGGGLGFGRFTADLTGPVAASRRVRYRVVAAGEWLENGFDNGERRLTLLPTLAVDVGARGTITVDTEIYQQQGRSYRHVVPATAEAQHGDFSAFPWDLNVNSPSAPYGWTGGNVSPGARLDLGLNDRVSLHVAGRYTRIDGDINVQALASVSPDGRTANRFQYHEVSTWNEYQTDTFAAIAATTGRVSHRIVTGIEAGLSTADSRIGVGAAPALDVFNPTYLPAPEPASGLTRYDVWRLGLYAADEIRFGRRVIVAPSLRWSHLAIDDRAATAGEAHSSEQVVSPSLGVVVLPRPTLSLYATYAQGFEPPTPGQYLEDGRALAPAENGSIEGGIKATLLHERVSLSGDVFRIRRTNVPEADARGFFRQIGEGRSHGLEFEATGSLARGLAMIGGYAWTRTEIAQDTAGFTGRELPNAPRHKAEAWTRYRFSRGTLSGLMAAGGLVYVSDRFTARDNVVVVPAFTRFDASGAYELAGTRLTVSVVAQNLTNRQYATSGAGATFIAAPLRRVALQLTTAF